MMVSAAATAPVDVAAARRAVVAWALYDLANVIFVVNIGALYFPLWIVDDAGGSDGDYGLANSLSMALVFLTAPLIGALSDQASRRVPFLVVSTSLCCALTAFLGTGGLLASLVLFVVANYWLQTGTIFYDALLPTVSTEANRGRVSGLGMGLGFVGAIIGVVMGLAVTEGVGAGKPLVFKLTALLFFLFAIPCFRWVREPRRADMAAFGRAAVGRALRELRGTAALTRRCPGLRRYLVGRVFYTDAANTLLAFMGIYTTKEVGFSDAQAQIVLLIGIVTGGIGAFVCGPIVDRVGPKRALTRLLGLWAGVFALIIAIAYLDLPRGLFWLVAALAGIAVGATGTTERPLLLRLTPPRYLGQVYGLYAMVGRFAAILGPLLWTAIVEWLGWGRPAAVLSLLLMVGIAAAILRPVRDERRIWAPEDLVGPPGPPILGGER